MMDNMPQQEKDTYWSYAIPGTDKVGRIPKPFDISLLANTVERANKYREGDQYAFDGFDKTVNDAVKVPWIPTTLQPIVENMANYSFLEMVQLFQSVMRKIHRKSNTVRIRA